MKKLLASIILSLLFTGCASNSGGEYGSIMKTTQDMAIITLVTLPITIPVAIISAPVVLPLEAIKAKQKQKKVEIPTKLQESMVQTKIVLLRDDEFSYPALAYDGTHYNGWISIHKTDNKQEWINFYQKDFQEVATIMTKQRPNQTWRAYQLKNQWFILDSGCQPLGKLGIVSKKFESMQEMDEEYTQAKDLCGS